MVSRLIANIVSGAAVGYITNDLAIKMLFEKKFGLGGVIIDTKEVFIEKISQLVEREIVNHHTLGREIATNDQVFEAALRQTIEDFFGKHLFEKLSPSFQIGDIPYIRLTTDYVRNQAEQSLLHSVPSLLDFTGKQVQIQQIVSPPQLTQVTTSLSRLLISSIQDENLLKETLLNFYQDFKQVPFNQLVAPNFWEKVSENTAQISADLHTLLKQQFGKQIDDLLRDVIHLLRADDLMQSLAKELSQKKIHEVLGIYYTNALADELLKRLGDIASSEEGKELLHNFADFIIRTLEKEKSTIFDLLSDDLAASTKGFLREKMPAILASLIDWVQERQTKLEALIDHTFKGNVPSGLKTMVLGLFVTSVSQSADVMKKVVDMLQTYQRNPNETAEKFTEKVIEFLQSNTIGDIIKRIKDNAKGMNLHDILVAGLMQGLKQIKTEEIAVFFEKKIGELVPKSEIEDFLQNGLSKLVNTQLKNKLLYDSAFSQLIAEQLKKQILKAGNQSLGEIIDERRFQNFAQTLAVQLMHLANTNEQRIGNYLYQTIGNQLQNKTLYDVLTENWKQYLYTKIASNGNNLVKQEIDKALKTPVRALQQYAIGNSGVMSKELKGLLINNLDNITAKKIEDIIATRLRKMDDSALKNVVEQFMGQELKPITILGAWLGGLAGGLLYYLPTPDSPLAYIGMASVAYGITGWGTNWQAIKMVFRPHKPMYVAGLQVPFTPGILAKNQARFANNMGNFVARHLLNEDVLRTSFEANKEKAYQTIYTLVAKDNYQLLRELLIENNQKISHALANLTCQSVLVEDNNQAQTQVKIGLENKLKETLQQFLHNKQYFNLAEIDTQKVEENVANFTTNPTFAANLSTQVSIGLQRFTQREKSVYEVIPESLRKNIQALLQEWVADKIGSFFDNLRNAEKQSDVLTQLEPQFLKYRRLGLDKYLEDTQKTAIMLNVSRFIHEKLIDTEIRNLLFNFVDVRLAEELSPERRINELMDGRLMAMLNDNLDFIMENVLNLGTEWLRTNKKQIADDVYKMALKKNPATFFYQSTIKETVLDLAEEGIPNFFADERQSLKDLVAVQAQTIGMSKLKDLNIQLDKTYLKSLLETFLAREEMLLSVQNLSYSILKELFKVPISVFLRVGGVENMRDLQRILSHELNIITKHLQQQGREKQTVIGNRLTGFISEILEEKLRNTKVKDVFARIDEETYRQSAQNIVKHLVTSSVFETQKREFIARFFEQIKKTAVTDLINPDVLQADLLQILNQVLAAPETKEFLYAEIQQTSSLFLEKLPEHISTESKDFLAKQIIEATLAALEGNLSPLINSVDLKKIVVDEIKAMDAAEIEKLFYGFAGTYFTKLINYGFGFGIAFGLASEAAIVYGIKAVS
jgi:uncharacterized membrane protein YheB (UPF0754 family)